MIDKNLLADPWWRLNNLYYIKNDKGKKIKFRPNKAQKLLYMTMHYLNIILKARQLGFTTFIDIFMLDRCLFNDNQNAGIVAHTKEDAEAFFEDKIKFAYDNLPGEIRLMISADNDSAKTLKFSNGSRIRVGTSLRSGTYQYVHISEFGKMCAKYPDKAEEVITGTLNTVAPGQIVFIESTAEGPFGHFYDMCQEFQALTVDVENGQTEFTMMDYKFFFYPWYLEPRYTLDEPVDIPDKLREYFATLEREEGIYLTDRQKWWYVKKSAEQKDKMHQEFPTTWTEAFEKTTELAILGKQLRIARIQKRITYLPFRKGIPVNSFWDLGRNDICAIWFHQHVEAFHHFIYYFEARLEQLGFYADKLRDFKQDFGWSYGNHYMPHDVETTDISEETGKTRKQILQEKGVSGIIVVPKTPNLHTAIEGLRDKFDTYKFDKEGCDEGLQRLAAYEWKYDKQLKTTRTTPVHGPASNAADALRQHSQGYRGDKRGFADQAQNVGGKTGRKYRRTTVNTVFNPSLKHVV